MHHAITARSNAPPVRACFQKYHTDQYSAINYVMTGKALDKNSYERRTWMAKIQAILIK